MLTAQREQCAVPCQAHRFFEKLHMVGASRTGISNGRMETHISFCQKTFQNASAYVDKVCGGAAFVPNTLSLSRVPPQLTACGYLCASCAFVSAY